MFKKNLLTISSQNLGRASPFILIFPFIIDENKWRGPAKVLGKDGQQVLLKHGGYYVRVHACRLMHSNPTVERSAAPGNVESVPTPSMPEAEEPVLEEPPPEQPVEPTSFTFVYDVEEEENVATENDECNLINFSSDCEVALPTIDLPMSPDGSNRR